MEFGVLGPLEVTAGGRPLGLAGARTRAVLAILLVHANQVVSSDRLREQLWPGHPAGKATDSLQVRLSELRKELRAAGEADRLVTRPPGYLLRVMPGELDTQRFEQLAAEGNAALAAGAAATAVERLDLALGLWRGPALADFDMVPSARAEAGRLEEQRLAALESRADALLACGRPRDLIAELETLTAAHPLRERFWSQRMLALYRAGRQADALRAYQELRDVLVAELAIEPGPELRELHTRILRQDPALAGPEPERAGATPGAVPQTRYAQTSDGIHIAFQTIGDNDALCAEIAGFLATTSHPGEPDRVLATILHAKPVGFTVVRPRQRLPRLGQQTATALEALTQDLIRAHRGRLIKNGANGLLATFDAPGQAIRCAASVVADAAAAGIQIQAGIHTGEVDLVGEDIAGDSVRITEGVAAQARPAEILVSRTVRDLVAGTGITFAERGSYVPNGPLGEWPLFAVTDVAPTSR